MVENTVFGFLLAVILGVISVIDWRHFRIPDGCNIILFITGVTWILLTAPQQVFVQIGFALLLLVVFWTIRFAHFKFSGEIGLGMGDVKMIGASGVWISPFDTAIFIFLSSSIALFYVLVVSRFRKVEHIPFGPFLSLGLFMTWSFNV